ncbi:5143_t:CDS:2 [Paraglomus brasilianum]|uniref:DNA-binding protein RAP1 n=1 Tax=Paraglomus brasilianum TaxID=144538 RepID=A0A9N8YWU9_9GLOM|nr:5143_t:CDS:2 [Paraglomus brasilianum]
MSTTGVQNVNLIFTDSSTGHPYVIYVKKDVPDRDNLMIIIQNHGGVMTEDPRAAQFILANPRKDTTEPGQYSFMFALDSIKEGCLQQPANYLMKVRTRKIGRAHYTKEEDDKLVQFVLEQQRLNSHLKGNEIYKQIEPEFPRHTWHSLRDHALKKIIPNLQHYQQAAPVIEVIEEKSTSQSSPTIQSNSSFDLMSATSPGSSTPISVTTPIATTSTPISTNLGGTYPEYFYSESEAVGTAASAKRRRAELKFGNQSEGPKTRELEWDDRNIMNIFEEHIKKKPGSKKCPLR